jgi:hypothetical protein
MDERAHERTGFQEGAPYHPTIDLRTDFVMAYGLNDTTQERVARWLQAGYVVHVMTGISWGQYQDYLNGGWDGEDHWADAQAGPDGAALQHGRSVDVPYMVPTVTFTEYLIEKLRPLLDLDVEAVHLEEPEFWDSAGYSQAFKREWQAFYGEPWQPPHGTVDAHYRAGKLKQHLLTRSLDRVTTVLRDEALRRGKDLRFYVPTHSLLNYTQWQIISPESHLRALPAVHGAIAQVWTGTSRTPNVYAGRLAERTFETSYLEYGISQDLTRGTNRTMWFLHDPIEDHAGRTWEDYRSNYQRTLVASLLHPGVSRFEVAPWPNRIFNRPYLREGSSERVVIPPEYATSYLVAMNTLRDMDQPVSAAATGPRIGVILSDTAMFQRGEVGQSERRDRYDGLQDALSDEGRARLNFSGFYGLALPPLFDGQRIVPLQLEAPLDNPAVLEDFDVVVLSYEFQKPSTPALHLALANWVRAGGALLYVGDGSDPYHGVREWWTGRYPTPAHHLAETLGVPMDAGAAAAVGAGWVHFVDADPATFSESPEKAEELVGLVASLARAAGHDWQSASWLSVRRGPYLIGAVLSEATGTAQISGRYLDLLDPALSVVTERELTPGDLAWLRDLTDEPQEHEVLASSGRIRDHQSAGTHLSYVCEGPTNVGMITALRAGAAPTSAAADGGPADWQHDADVGVLWVRHAGVPAGTAVQVSFG